MSIKTCIDSEIRVSRCVGILQSNNPVSLRPTTINGPYRTKRACVYLRSMIPASVEFQLTKPYCRMPQRLKFRRRQRTDMSVNTSQDGRRL